MRGQLTVQIYMYLQQNKTKNFGFHDSQLPQKDPLGVVVTLIMII